MQIMFIKLFEINENKKKMIPFYCLRRLCILPLEMKKKILIQIAEKEIMTRLQLTSYKISEKETLGGVRKKRLSV